MIDKDKVKRIIISNYDTFFMGAIMLDNIIIKEEDNKFYDYVPRYCDDLNIEDVKKMYNNAEEIIICENGNIKTWNKNDKDELDEFLDELWNDLDNYMPEDINPEDIGYLEDDENNNE